IRIGIANSQIVGKFRPPFELLLAIGQFDIAQPLWRSNVLFEKIKRARIMFDGALEQFFSLILDRELLNALYVVVGQRSVGNTPDGFMGARFCAGGSGAIGAAVLNANNSVKNVPRP